MVRCLLLLAPVMAASICVAADVATSYGGLALKAGVINRTKTAASACACRNQCLVDMACYGVTSSLISSSTYNCQYSNVPHGGSTGLQLDFRASVKTLLKGPAIIPMPTAAPSCTAPFVRVGTVGCLHFSTTQRDFNGAQTECVSLWGTLASFGVLANYMQVADHLWAMSGAQLDYWVNIVRVDSTKFRWMGGETLSTVKGDGMWFARAKMLNTTITGDEPNNMSTLGCARMFKNMHFFLDDYSCAQLMCFICQRWF